MAVIGVNYEEGIKKEGMGYESVRISYGKRDKEKLFDSGNFIKDWYDCVKFILHEIIEKEHVTFSSSVDHFIMDGAPYDSAYLKIKDEKPFLDYEFAYKDKGTELFVPTGTKPTWHELREICNDPKDKSWK